MPQLPLRRGHTEGRSSKGDVALMQMQIAAHARNQRWHDFLCIKRDQLLARLRQQGYSRPALPGLGEGERVPDTSPAVRSGHSDGTGSATTRWGPPGVEAAGTRDTRGGRPAGQANNDGEQGDHREDGDYGDD